MHIIIMSYLLLLLDAFIAVCPSWFALFNELADTLVSVFVLEICCHHTLAQPESATFVAVAADCSLNLPISFGLLELNLRVIKRFAERDDASAHVADVFGHFERFKPHLISGNDSRIEE